MNPIRHKELTGVNNELILKNIKLLLENGYNVKVRMPMPRIQMTVLKKLRLLQVFGTIPTFLRILGNWCITLP